MRKIIITNIEDFIFENKENVKLYHGSKSEFDTFDDKLISSGEGSDLFGKGFYLTSNQDVANFYGKLIAKKDRIEKYTFTGPFGSEVPVYHKDANDYAEQKKVVNTFNIDGNILNTEDYILDDEFINIIKESYILNSGLGEHSNIIFDKILSFMRNNKKEINKFRGELLYLIEQVVLGDKNIMNDIINHIKKIGYDGVKYRPDQDFEGNKDSWNYVIYNKHIITKK